MSDEEEFLDIKQAAQFLSVSETSLRRWTNEGRLACVRVGLRRERRFRRSELLAFMEEQPAGNRMSSADQRTSREHTVIDGLPVEFGFHACGLYSSDAARMAMASNFLFDGIRRGSVCYLIGPSAVRREILGHLSERHSSLDEEIDAGTLVPSDYAASGRAQIEYFEAQFDTARRRGARSLRVVGDLWEVSRRLDKGELQAYESGYEQHIARRFPVVTMCLYDARRFSGLDLLGAINAHRDGLGYPANRWLA